MDKTHSALLLLRMSPTYPFTDDTAVSFNPTKLADKSQVISLQVPDTKLDTDILPVVGVFGGHNSGKTRALQAITGLSREVMLSFSDPLNQETSLGWGYDPTPQHEDVRRAKASEYLVALIVNGKRWGYKVRFSGNEVAHESAYHYPRGKPAKVFQRDYDDLRFGLVDRATQAAKSMLREDALFLSTAAASGSNVLSSLYLWFAGNARYVQGDLLASSPEETIELIRNDKQDHHKQTIAGFMNACGMNVTSVSINRPLYDGESLLSRTKITRTVNGQPREEMLLTDTSLGTKACFGLAGTVLVSLKRGTVVLIDDIGSNLHPDIVAHIVSLYQNPETNPHNAQLLFTSHDAGMLNSNKQLLGRDQVWIASGVGNEQHALRCLTEFKPGKNFDIAARYAAGSYGAVTEVSPIGLAQAAQQIVGDQR